MSGLIELKPQPAAVKYVIMQDKNSTRMNYLTLLTLRVTSI